MKFPVISIIQKTRSECFHSSVTDSLRVRAEDIWMEQIFYNKKLFVSDKSFKQCSDCRQVVYPSEYKSFIKDLKKSCSILAENIGKSQTIHIDLSDSTAANNQTIVETDKTQEFAGNILIPKYQMSQVILSEQTSRQIQEALTKIKYHSKIYNEWGFKEIDKVGNAVMCIFHGMPGTGKTRCAEAFAYELKKSFLLVSVADVVGRYMGDYSKNISRVFQKAETENALILFDEAYDFLSERFQNVTQGTEAEINSARSTLLIELEKFQGIVIFATNYYERIERAFNRRILYHVKFDLPDAVAREKLWELHIPLKAPLAEDRKKLIEKLVEISDGLCGGDILSIMRKVLPAAIIEDINNPVVSYAIFSQIIEEIRQREHPHELTGKKNDLEQMRRMFGMEKSEN